MDLTGASTNVAGSDRDCQLAPGDWHTASSRFRVVSNSDEPRRRGSFTHA
jgi:hypothetical protein